VSGLRVAVVGGGLSGLSAAVALADAGASVALFEARPRLGGATFSTRRAGLEVDNGQHVFLRGCQAYRGFLRRLGVAGRVVLQPRLAVPVLAPGARCAWLRRHPLPAPLHLAPSLLGYRHLPLRERLRAARVLRRLGALDSRDARVDATRLGDWLAQQPGASPALEGLLDLLLRPTLNVAAGDASLAQAAFVLRTGFLSEPDFADVGWSAVPLAQLHAEPAAALLRAAGAALHLRAPVERIECAAGAKPALWLRGARVEADAVVLAADHEAAARLLPAAAGIDPAALRRLGRSPIVNLHVVFDRRVTQLDFAAAVGSPVEWLFDRTRSAGLERGQYLALSLSDAGAWLGHPRAELARVFLPALAELLPAARGARVLRFFASCERAATFRQGPGTLALRPGAASAAPGLFLAGAYTDTGWPATMEGAVRSGLAAARKVLARAGRRPAPPAEAA
jgi:squalene-associated FAD-dependent desaturase